MITWEKLDYYIDFYIEKFNLVLKHYYDKDKHGIVGDLYLYLNKNKIGHLHYSIDRTENNLNIDIFYIKNSKPSINLNTKGELSKLLLLYLLSVFIPRYVIIINSITIKAMPSMDKARSGKEFCLLCFYEKELGFEPISSKGYDINELKECIRQLKPVKEIIETCILCQCQKEKIEFTKRDLSHLQVDMKVLLPKLENLLDNVYKNITKLVV